MKNIIKEIKKGLYLIYKIHSKKENSVINYLNISAFINIEFPIKFTNKLITDKNYGYHLGYFTSISYNSIIFKIFKKIGNFLDYRDSTSNIKISILTKCKLFFQYGLPLTYFVLFKSFYSLEKINKIYKDILYLNKILEFIVGLIDLVFFLEDFNMNIYNSKYKKDILNNLNIYLNEQQILRLFIFLLSSFSGRESIMEIIEKNIVELYYKEISLIDNLFFYDFKKEYGEKYLTIETEKFLSHLIDISLCIKLKNDLNNSLSNNNINKDNYKI